jgi:preprotein translocase subunit SecA
VPASQQFDLARRQQALAQAREQQAGSGGSAPAAPSAPATSAPAASAAAQRMLTPKDLEGVGRNDACPCGSGQKFKKCHGRDL